MQTNVITYNLRDRGRQYRGKERNFNIRAIVGTINGPACQERVKNRDMQGYYGHWTRLKFGMNPVEGKIAGEGKPVIVEPALVTTLLRARDDGTIEHQAEFLDTDSGQVAAKLFASRTGGFSSAIDPFKPEFFGFDYVLEPNYTTNRGYALDDVREMTLDDIEAAIYDEQLRGMSLLLDSANAERERVCEIIERVTAENEQLLSMLAAKGIDAGAALDSAGHLPIAVSVDSFDRIRRDTSLFRSAALPSFAEPKKEGMKDSAPVYDRLLRNFTR